MPRALLSVWNKEGIVELAGQLAEAGWELVASGGTAAALQEAGLDVIPVSDLTGEPEMLDGRVKTLHPAVFAAILARDSDSDRKELKERDWQPLDLVVVNLYPFEEIIRDPETTLDQALEMIDIGGNSLLRAAAKNFPRTTVLCDPADYPDALQEMEALPFRRKMARKAFARTAAYDAAIRSYMDQREGIPAPLRIAAYPVLNLRYGENPHQAARLYGPSVDSTPMGGRLLQGKPLSYNNLLDLDGAWCTVRGFQKPAAAVVKHTSPCGAAVAADPAEAVRLAIASDPVSAFGSVIACNREIDVAFLEAVGDLFVECIAAPSFDTDALALLQNKKNLRALQVPQVNPVHWDEMRTIFGGLLVQQSDPCEPDSAEGWKVVSERPPSESEFETLRFAWKAVQTVKSNAVVLAKSEAESRFTVGIGGGQPNRVDCVRIAGERAGERGPGSVLASDAFFPFPDGIEAAQELGVTAVVQPGGSRRDSLVIDAVNKAGMAMIFTGMRHFRH